MLREMLMRTKGHSKDYQSKRAEEEFNKKSFEKASVDSAIDRAEHIDRTDSICDVLIGCLDVSKKERVLEVGCYTGLYQYLFEKRGYKNNVGVDISADAIRIANAVKKKCRLKSRFEVGDAERLKYPGGSFDRVFFNATLHHLPEKSMEKALLEAKRVLKKGGRVVVAEPNLWHPKILIDHLRYEMSPNEFPYSYSDMVRIVGKHFKVTSAFTRRFVPRLEEADFLFNRIPLIKNLGTQVFIVGVK